MIDQLKIGSQKSDFTTLISDATWEEYRDLMFPNCLISFRNGVITIVSPGRNHEIISDLIRAVIWGYCGKMQSLFFTFNQTRLTCEGKEPDVAYSFGENKDKPDLAVEVNLTLGECLRHSDSIAGANWSSPPFRRNVEPLQRLLHAHDDLTKYEYLEIPEVWLWEQNRIKFFVRVSRGYTESAVSICLKGLESDRLTDIINDSVGKSLEVEAKLRDENS